MVDTLRTSDGVTLRVLDTGPADAPVTVLLTHGWTSDLRVWDLVAAGLAGRARVVRFDHRGHGDSDPAPRGSATLARLGDDLAELIAERAPTGALVLVGHSMGGMAMMALADRHPALVRDRVAAAFFVSTSSGRMDEVTFGLPAPLVRAAARREAARREAARRAKPVAGVRSAPRPPSKVRALATLAFLRWLVFGSRFRLVDLRAVADQLARSHKGSTGGLRGDIGKHGREAALQVYRDIPTQVVTGERDRLIPAGHSRVIAAACPGAELVVYPKAGHMVPYERAPELTARILAACGRVEARSV